MSDLFTDCGDAQDEAYKNICLAERPRNQEIKKFCESLWSKFKTHADPHFLTQIRRHFYDRYWEMYLSTALIDWGYDIQSKDKGPDVLIELNNTKIWIEAVTSSNGNSVKNADVVPNIEYEVAQQVPEEQIILRLRSSIEDKLRAYHKYINESVLESNEPYIIALNGSKINFMSSDDDIPYILKAILPIGDYHYDFANDIAGISFRDEIIRKKGTGIPTDVYFNDNYRHISAILYSNTHAGHFDKEIGSDFMLIHNPNAINSLPIDIIKNGKVIKIDIDEENNTFSYHVENV